MADRRTTFVTTYLPYAQQASTITGIDPMVILAQAAHETAWGKKAPGNNFFGIKGGGQTFATHEYVNGRRVNVKAGFRRYDSPLASFLDWAKLMQTPRYAGVLAARTPEEQIKALKAAGYATDPAYVSKLKNVRNQVARISGEQPTSAVAGNPVLELQKYLAQNGFDPGPIDGVLGDRTLTALNNYNAAVDPEGAAASQAILAQSGVTNPSPQQMADAFRQATTARQTAMAMGQAPIETPAPQTTQMAYADAVDRMDTEPPALQAIDDMLTGQSADQVLAGGPRMDPRRATPASFPIAPGIGTFARTAADVLDAGPTLRPDLPARFRPGPGGAIGQDLGAMSAGMPLPPDRPGGAPPANIVPVPPDRPGGAPDAGQVPIPPSRASGLPDPTLRPDINDPSLSFNRQSGRGPDMREAIPDQIDTMVAGREEFPAALPAAPSVSDVSPPVAASSGPRIPANTDLTPALLSRVREMQGIGPFPARPETIGALPDAASPYDDVTRQYDIPGAFTRANESPLRPSSPVSMVGPPPTQAAVVEPEVGTGPYGQGIPAGLAFDRRRMDDAQKSPISLPETYAQLLDMPDDMSADFPDQWIPGLLPLRQEVVAGAAPDEMSLDAVPESDAGRFWNARPPVQPDTLARRFDDAFAPKPVTTTLDRVMSIINEGREPTVSLTGGPRDQAEDIGTYRTGEWMTGPESGVISRAQGWWEPTPEPEVAGIPQGDSDWSPTNDNAAMIAALDADAWSAPPVAQSVIADALDEADIGGAGGQPLIGSYGVMGTTAPRIDISAYHPEAMVLNAPGSAIAGRPVGGGSLQFTSPATAPVASGGGGAPIIVQAPQLGGGGGDGLVGRLFGGIAAPQWTGQVATGMSPGGGQWWSGSTNAMGGSTAITWTGSNGQPVTAYENNPSWPQSGYSYSL